MLTRPHNVASAFVQNASMHGERTFVRVTTGKEGRDYSFSSIRDQAYAYNAHFRRAGLTPGSVIAIILTHGVELYTAFLGSMMAGLVPTIMPFPTPKQDREKYWSSHKDLFSLSGIEAVFTYQDNLQDISEYLGNQIQFVATANDVDLSIIDDRIEHHTLAVLQHSSGTTALKKGVMLTHDAIFNQVASYSQSIGLNDQSKIVTWLPLYHDMGFIACFITPMVLGCQLSHLDAFVWSARPTLILDEIQQFRGEYIWLPNFAYNHIANSVRGSKEWDLGSVKAIINCSEPCKPDTFSVFHAVPQFRNLSETALQVCYAMAENVFAVSQTEMGRPPRVIRVTEQSFRDGAAIELTEDSDGIALLSCGKIIDGTKVAIVAATGEKVNHEKLLGEVVITGECLYSGYYCRPELTGKKLVDGWHHSGDVGFLLDGELFVAGRLDDLLIIRGKNIYAHEVEAAVNALGLIIPGRAVAFSIFAEGKGEASLVILAEGDDISKQKEIGSAIRRTVEATFGVSVADFRLLPPRSLRKTTSGKLSRSENSRLYMEIK